MPNSVVARNTFLTGIFILTFAAAGLGAVFQNGHSYAVGQSPKSLAAGDFNKDGIVDLVVGNSGQSSVDVLLGVGDGSFGHAVEYKAGGPSPNSLAVGDFNGDGNLDVVVGCNTVVVILLGNGDGTFQLPMQVAAPGTQYIATADFNNDGILDLVYEDGGVEVQLGNGDGTFQPAQTFFRNSVLSASGIADFNGDGNLDLAVVLLGEPGYVVVLLGTGTGAFLPGPAKYFVGLAPQSMAVGDFNADGKLDIAVSDAQSNNNNFSHGSVTLLLGQGDGTFRLFNTYLSVTDATARTIVTGDFNNDGRTDLMVVNDITNDVTELLNNGDGTFQRSINWSVGNQPKSLLVDDFNGDGKLDLVTADSGSDDITVLLGEMAGAFSGARNFRVGDAGLLQTFPLFGAVGDFNEDGITDLAVTNPGAVQILLGRGHGTFAPAINYPTSDLTTNPDVAVADLNGDSHVDIVEVNQGTGSNDTVTVLLGKGDGTFNKGVNYTVGVFSVSVAIADLNGDGIPDLAVTNGGTSQGGSISLLFGKGDGTFRPAITLTDGFPVAGRIIAADFNNDGKEDLMEISEGGALVILGNGDGTFQSPIISVVGDGGGFGVVADFNNDGKLDVAVADPGGIDVDVSLGNGDGSFQTRTIYNLGDFPVGVAVADVNSDGVPDIAVVSKLSSFIFLQGNGDGTFTPAPGGKVGTTPASIIPADFNGDAHPDLAIFNVGSNEVSILLNTSH